jgi:hypothetical protein
VDLSNPYVVTAQRLLNLACNKDDDQIQNIHFSKHDDKGLVREVLEWFPEEMVFIPLNPPKILNSQWSGILLIARNKGFNKKDVELLSQVSDIFSHAFGAFHTVSWFKDILLNIKYSLKSRWYWYVITTFIFLIPLPNTVMVPAEVVAKDPVLIRSSLDGVIENVYVEPGQSVKKGDELLAFDTESLRTKFLLAQEEVQVALNQLNQLQQEVLTNKAERFRLAAARGKLEEAKARKDYVESQLKRTIIYASQDGIVVYEKSHDLLGIPVSVGEKLMYMASPKSSELEIELPVYQAIQMPDNAKIRFFTNISPHLPEKATLKYHSYSAHETQTGQMSYRLKATWDNNATNLRIGLKGNAKIYGYSSPIIWKIMRQPLYHIRKWLGW